MKRFKLLGVLIVGLIGLSSVVFGQYKEVVSETGSVSYFGDIEVNSKKGTRAVVNSTTFTYDGYFGNFGNLDPNQVFNVNNYISTYIPSSKYKNTACLQTSNNNCSFYGTLNGTPIQGDLSLGEFQGVCWNLNDTLVITNRTNRVCPALVFLPSEALINNLSDSSTVTVYGSTDNTVYDVISSTNGAFDLDIYFNPTSVDYTYSSDSSIMTFNSLGGGSALSDLYINGINQLSAPVINITIPLEYQWDYEYTGDYLNIDLSGQNVDYEYIDGIIRTQNSTPNNEDFNNIVSGLIPLFVPGLVIILFLIFIFRFIKKIF